MRPLRHRRRRDILVMLMTCAFHWGIWGLLAALVSAQFLGIVWDSADSYQYVIYGQSPLNGPAPIAGTNDEPYSDRNLVCVPQGATFVPTQLSAALRDERLTKIVDHSGASVHGYRVCKRELISLDASTVAHYVPVCDALADMLDVVQDRCNAMGYNVTRDALRVVDDTHSNTTVQFQRGVLPVLVMPFWDNAVHAHYAIPGWDGMACLFRLVDLPGVMGPVVRGTTRTSRDEKTRAWLKAPSGAWRNGWYEDDATGQRWNADMLSSWTHNKLGIDVRHFDSRRPVEFNCSGATASAAVPPIGCDEPPVTEQWGSSFRATDQVVWANQAAISNGSRFGLFLFEATKKRTVQTNYSLETLISNVSIALLLFRWFVTLAVLLNSYRLGLTEHPSAGLGGCISSSRTFNVLPLMLLPRLKITLAAFWTAGCEFEGQQAALAEAWAAIYPGIAEFTLFYFSTLNFVAKLLRRRMSDVLYGPTLLLLCLLHRFRLPLALSGLLGFDGRTSTVVMSDEFDALRLVEFFTTDAAMRINGNVQPLFYGKLAVLLVNLIPLLVAARPAEAVRSAPLCHVEEAIKIRASTVGGLGRPATYEDSDTTPVVPYPTADGLSKRPLSTKQAPTATLLFVRTQSVHPAAVFAPVLPATLIRESLPTHAVSSYDVVRLGYLVFGGQFLVSYEDWYVVSCFAPLRHIETLWNHRIVLFEVRFRDGCYHVVSTAQLCYLTDPRLQSIPFYAITVGAFR